MLHAISALISAASPEKMDRYTKLTTTSRTINIHQQSSPLGDQKYGEIHYHKENKTNGGKRNEFSAESNQFNKNQKWEYMKCSVTVKTARDQ